MDNQKGGLGIDLRERNYKSVKGTRQRQVNEIIKNPDKLLREYTKSQMAWFKDKNWKDYGHYKDVNTVEEELWNDFKKLGFWQDELADRKKEYEKKTIKYGSTEPTLESVVVAKMADESFVKIKPNFTDYCAKGDNGGNCARAIPQPDKNNNYLYPRDWNDYDAFAVTFYKFSGGSVKDFKEKYDNKEIIKDGITYKINYVRYSWSDRQPQFMISKVDEQGQAEKVMEEMKDDNGKTVKVPMFVGWYFWINENDDGVGVLLGDEKPIKKEGGKKRKTKRRMNMRKKQTKRKSKGKTRKVVKKNKKRATRRR